MDETPRSFLHVAQMTYLVLVLAGLLLPLAALVPMSFSPTDVITALPGHWSARWYAGVLRSPEWRQSLLSSLLTALVSSVLATSLGYMGATALVRRLRRLRSLVQIVILSPLMVPEVVLALSTYAFFSSIRLSGSWVAIAVGQSLMGLPVATVIIAASLRGIDESLVRAATSIGASPFQSFWHVVLPMALPGVLSAAAFSFLIAFDELLIALFLTTPNLQTLPVRIYQAVQYELTPAVAAVSVLLIGLLCFALAIAGLCRWAVGFRAAKPHLRPESGQLAASST